MRRDPRLHLAGHLEFLRSLPCAVCLSHVSTEAAHVRYSDASVGKVNAGVGQKPHDFWCVPLCGADHRDQHETGDEFEWWRSKGIDPLRLAMALFLNTGDHERATLIVANAKQQQAA